VWLPDAVEDALRDFIYKAILSAYRLSEATLDEFYTFCVGATGHLDELFEEWQQAEPDTLSAEEPA
jgi:hypothetical protein